MGRRGVRRAGIVHRHHVGGQRRDAAYQLQGGRTGQQFDRARQGRRRRRDDDAGGAGLDQRLHLAAFGLRVVLGNPQHHLEARVPAALGQALGDGAIEIVLDVRNDQPHQRAGAAAQDASRGVQHVAQFLCRLPHPRLGVVAEFGMIVQRARDGGVRNTQRGGDVLDGDGTVGGLGTGHGLPVGIRCPECTRPPVRARAGERSRRAAIAR